MAKKFQFEKILKQFQAFKSEAPRVVGRMMVNHSMKAFREQGFTDSGFVKWTDRKRGNKADKATNRRRALLVDSGAMRRSIRIGRANWHEVIIGAYGIPYAQYHNQGTDKIPQRRFMGGSVFLRKQIRVYLRKEVQKMFKQNE